MGPSAHWGWDGAARKRLRKSLRMTDRITSSVPRRLTHQWPDALAIAQIRQTEHLEPLVLSIGCFGSRADEVPLTLAPFSPHRAFCRYLFEPVVAAILPGGHGVDRAETNGSWRCALSWHPCPLVSHFQVRTPGGNFVPMRW